MLSAGKLPFPIITLLLIGELLSSCGVGSKNVVVKPMEIDSTLLNPGRGFTSTGNTFNENIGSRLHPLCGVNQQRFFWDVLEPEEGKINYALVDSGIARSVRNGQLLNFRVMCQDVDMKVSKWALNAGVKSPFYDNAIFIEKQINLIKALGERYDGNPGVCFVDIGTIGQWGEWHVDPDAKDPAKIVFPTDENARKIIDAYFASFKKTPLVSLIAFKQKYGFQYGTSKGAGWRADCWGDMDSLGWNHMKGVYPQALDGAKAHDSWKNGPIALETCWTMDEWFKRGWDLDYILDKALEWHVTEVNNGTEAIPREWYPKIREFEKKLGYRFVLNDFSYPSQAKKGEAINCTMSWQNKGVAPLYNNYQLAIQLVSKSSAVKPFVIATNADLKKLFPGKASLNTLVTIPPEIIPGDYEVELGIVVPGTTKPAIQLAIAGKTAAGWYRMGSITIIN
ncbi:MAG: DUF4832 domain-containing protein [Ferruginibacter sp.]